MVLHLRNLSTLAQSSVNLDCTETYNHICITPAGLYPAFTSVFALWVRRVLCLCAGARGNMCSACPSVEYHSPLALGN